MARQYVRDGADAAVSAPSRGEGGGRRAGAKNISPQVQRVHLWRMGLDLAVTPNRAYATPVHDLHSAWDA
jgi:hypothetical protein